MNVEREAATATLLPNGHVLIAGGLIAITFFSEIPITLASTEIYDPATNTFATSTPTMNSARLAATAALLPNGKVLIAGGFGESALLSSTEIYDPITNTFAASTPSMNTARDGATATLLPNGKVLIAGGSGNSGPLSSTEIYDSTTNTFAASTPSMNDARISATATLLPNNKVLIAGGFNDTLAGPGAALSSTEIYDPISNTFAASTPSMNIARDQATATLLPNGKVLIAGGFGGSDPVSDDTSSTEIYDSATNSFATSTPSMHGVRDSATATLLPNGKVLIAGGEVIPRNPGVEVSVLSSTEIYTP
jgi:hypothetical protein